MVLNDLPLPWTTSASQLGIGLLFVFPVWLSGVRIFKGLRVHLLHGVCHTVVFYFSGYTLHYAVHGIPEGGGGEGGGARVFVVIHGHGRSLEHARKQDDNSIERFFVKGVAAEQLSITAAVLVGNHAPRTVPKMAQERDPTLLRRHSFVYRLLYCT